MPPAGLRSPGARSVGARPPRSRQRPPSLHGMATGLRPEPSLRLRHLLLVGVVVALGAWLWPRGRAAFALHSLAVKKAEHALCMAGPMGPTLLREQPAALEEVLRLRLIRSSPDARPFKACLTLADEIPMSHAAYRAHSQPARAFGEYLLGPTQETRASVADFEFSTSDVAKLSEQAWPFVRRGYLRLMVPSRHASEAVHPAAIPGPGLGRGLPASSFHYRSTLTEGDRVLGAFGSGANARTLSSRDGGVTWQAGGRDAASEIMDRCVADAEGRAFSLSLTESGRQVVVSQGPEAPPQASVLSEAGESVSAVSCDHSALVALLVQQAEAGGLRPVRLRLCPFRLPCRDLLGPDESEKLFFPADIARVSGDTILSRSYGGITRVTSSRDDGRSWSPWIVAFDAKSSGVPLALAPYRLLATEGFTLLFGRPAAADGSYLVLRSRDHGASFRAP